MKIIPIEEAVGLRLSHDLTGIVPGKGENITFPRGYRVRDEDVERLKNMGKYHVKVLEDGDGLVHENDGARAFAEKAAGEGLILSEAREGKVHAFARYRGLLLSDPERMLALNLTDGMKISAKRRLSLIEEGEKAATMVITPLEIEESVLNQGLSLLEEPLVSVAPFHSLRIGIVTTGNEVYEGRIQDAFLPFLKGKLEPYGYAELKQLLVPDDQAAIDVAIGSFLEQGFDLVFLTGGLSVDADDCTLKSVREHPGIEVVCYGSPVLPGAMFLAAYHQGRVPLIGLPAGLLRGGNSILDVVLPLLLAGKKLTREYVASLGDGGLL